MPTNSKLDDLRARIDAIDGQLVRLISERAAIALEVAEVKYAVEDQPVFYRPEREAEVLRRVAGLNAGPLPAEVMTRLVREIMSACLALEEQLNIGYLGPRGSFTQTAVDKHFGHSVKTTALATIDQVFREVESGACQYGIVPIENSIEGVVNHTHDMLINSSLNICGEVELRIHQHLMSKTENISAITRVFSHQQSLAQCRAWLDRKLPGIERFMVSSNAEAARLAGDDPTAAAVAGESAAELYGLTILERNIEDEPDNTTRFLVIGRLMTSPSGHDKTTLIFSTPNKPGALHHMLICFSQHDVSMTRIESRPSRTGLWDYVFFVDIEGHCRDQKVADAIEQLRDRAAMVKVLGSYPRSVV